MSDKIQTIDIAMFGNGTTQYSRLPNSLLPDKVKVEGRELEDLLAYTLEFSKLVRFYNQTNEIDGDWSPFLTSDISFILASIVSVDLDRVEEEFSALAQKVLQSHQIDKKAIHLKEIFKFILNIAQTFNNWLIDCKKLAILETTELEFQIVAEIESVIRGQLRSDLSLLNSYYQEALSTANFKDDFKLDFSVFDPVWDSPNPPTGIEFFKGTSPLEQMNKALIKLRLLYRSFYNTLSYSKFNFKDYFDTSINQKSNHSPDMALLIAFLNLYQYAQKGANHISHRYLKYYYEHYLKQFQQKNIPDEVHVSFLLADHANHHFLPKGTQLSAGLNESGNEIIYETTQDIELNKADVESLRTIYLSKYSKIDNSSYQLITGIYAAPIANSRDGNGLDFENEHEPWPTFGEEQADKPNEANTMIRADLGFAFASPIFFLREGNRKVQIRIALQPDSTNILKKLLQDVREKANLEPGNRETLNYEDAFYRKIFNQVGNDRNIQILASGNRGWVTIDSNSIRVVASGPGNWKELELSIQDTTKSSILDALTIEFQLAASKPAITAFNPAVIPDEHYITEFPVVKILLSDNVEPYPYSFLRDLKIQGVEIDVEVENLRQLDAYNDIGLIDTNQPFQPFGPQPTIGSYLLLGSTEMFKKALTEMEVEINWLNIPTSVEDFKNRYKQYRKDLAPSKFKVRMSALSDNEFNPYEEDDNLLFPLFNTGKDDDPSISLRKSSFPVGKDQLNRLSINPNPYLESPNPFDINTNSGYFKLELAEPPEAFGHFIYQKVFTDVVTHNAKSSSAEDELPIPSEPYTPMVKSISVNYKANTRISWGAEDQSSQAQIYHIHPFGLVNILRKDAISERFLVPQFKHDGHLFIGLSDLKPLQTISLLFQLTTKNTRGDSSIYALPAVEFSYLSRNSWVNFSDRELLSDSTDQFTKTGIIQLRAPRRIPQRNTILPEGLFWISISVNGNVEALCHAIDILPQTVPAKWVDNGEDSHLRAPLPPDSITSLVDQTSAIQGIEQPFESYGGKPAENLSEFFSRISERLRHKGRGITLWDYERLVLEKFHTVFQAKCLSHLNYPEDIESRDGIIMVLVPQRNRYLDDSTPRVNYKYLLNVENYLKQYISPFTQLKVRNPQYEYIRILCNIKFDQEQNQGLSLQQLYQDLNHFIAPWWYDHTLEINIGQSIDENIILNFIKGLPYVKFVTKFSILHIVENEDGTYTIQDTAKEVGIISTIKAMPWGIFVPDSDHQIEIIDIEEEEEPQEAKAPIRFQNKVDISKDSKYIVIKPKVRKKLTVKTEKGKDLYTVNIKI